MGFLWPILSIIIAGMQLQMDLVYNIWHVWDYEVVVKHQN